MKTTFKPREKQGGQESIPKISDGKEDKDNKLRKEVAQLQNKTDTAPDEFIAPSADTDQPLDDGIVNDATLRGEDHQDDNIDNLEAKLKNSELSKQEKKNGKDS